MNLSPSDNMIDENEIRTALKTLRPNATALTEGVRRRIELATSLEKTDRSFSNRSFSSCEKNDSQANEWLRIAASFAPIHLLTRNVDSSIAPISFVAISLGKKLVVIFAFPFLCFFMIGMTLIGMMRIRAAQKGQDVGRFDIELARQATQRWWKHYGWVAGLVFVAALVAPFLGWTMPLMIALVCSGFAAVSFVRTLAKENLVERNLIGAMCAAALGLLGQLSQTFSNNSNQVLDPILVTGVLISGAFLIAAFVKPYGNRRTSPSLRNLSSVGFIVAASLILVVSTQSYWRGVTASNIRTHVESFDGDQLGLWEDWADAAKWLNETGIGFDKQIVQRHFEQELGKSPQMQAWMDTAGIRSGLIDDSKLASYTESKNDRSRLADSQLSTQPFFDIKSDYFAIAASAVEPDFDAADRDVLTKRLSASWSRLDSSDFDYNRLKNALLLTELFKRIDPIAQLAQRTADVHRWLVSHQITKPLAFRNGGGFSVTEPILDSDYRATLAAVCLMENYGVPAELDLPKLRSYLRPTVLYDFTAYDYVPKKIAREKLYQLSGIAPMTVMDYLQTDLLLWLAMLLVLLLAYATYNSPAPQSTAFEDSH